MKILKYLEYIQHKEKEQPQNGQALVYDLSVNLQQEIKREFYGNILKQFKLMAFNYSFKCLDDLALIMQESFYGPGETIYSQGVVDDRLFFIAKGKVEQYIETPKQIVSFQTLIVK